MWEIADNEVVREIDKFWIWPILITPSGIGIRIYAGKKEINLYVRAGNITYVSVIENNYSILDSILINTIYYKNIFRFSEKLSSGEIRNLYYNKTFGVLRYENIEGRVWEIIKK